MPDPLSRLDAEISRCRLCASRFQATETAHTPRPVTRLSTTARILIAGQAPGARVHASGLPFDDPSGERLRAWMGVDRTTFYDQSRIAILPMAFCFPGYRKGADLPPPPVCARTWRAPALDLMPQVTLILAVGGYAQKWHIAGAGSVTEMVRDWKAHAAGGIIPLPHPSWRNTGWLKRNPWFAAELLPVLRRRIEESL